VASDRVGIATFLSFGLGVFTALLGVAAKYVMDYRVAARRLELDERAAISAVFGNSLGQLRRAAQRLHDRIEACFRDQQHLAAWLAPAGSPADDGYFLRSFVQRLFTFLAWAAVVQGAVDSLPDHDLQGRTDLRRLYTRLEVCKEVLSHVALLPDYPGYEVAYEGYHLFIGTLDDVSDLGLAVYNENHRTVPRAAFDQRYNERYRALGQVRWWLAAAGNTEPYSAVVLARLACLQTVLRRILDKDQDRAEYGKDKLLAERLLGVRARLSVGYPLELAAPASLDRLTVEHER
jgi:hypothetical protein